MNKQLTPKDIERPGSRTGYVHVSHRAARPTAPYRAQSGTRPHHAGEAVVSWYGPSRVTALEAAQDYCDYVNGNAIAVPTSFAAPPVSLGVTVHRKRGKKRKGVPFVDSKFDLYDIEMFDPMTGTLLRRKVGITASGDGRYAGVAATFGLGFRPRTQGVTYPNKASALEAEAILVRTIERDPQWVKVGKECFAPAP